jgi:hypothetical protein
VQVIQSKGVFGFMSFDPNQLTSSYFSEALHNGANHLMINPSTDTR